MEWGSGGQLTRHKAPQSRGLEGCHGVAIVLGYRTRKSVEKAALNFVLVLSSLYPTYPHGIHCPRPPPRQKQNPTVLNNLALVTLRCLHLYIIFSHSSPQLDYQISVEHSLFSFTIFPERFCSQKSRGVGVSNLNDMIGDSYNLTQIVLD